MVFTNKVDGICFTDKTIQETAFSIIDKRKLAPILEISTPNVLVIRDELIITEGDGSLKSAIFGPDGLRTTNPDGLQVDSKINMKTNNIDNVDNLDVITINDIPFNLLTQNLESVLTVGNNAENKEIINLQKITFHKNEFNQVYEDISANLIIQSPNKIDLSANEINCNCDIVGTSFIGTATNANNIKTTNTNANLTHYINFSDSSTTGTGAVQKTNGITCNPSLKSISATSFIGTASNSTNSVITSSNNDASYNLLIATTNSGTLPIYGSNNDLTYNPNKETLYVKNLMVTGFETNTGSITTNILKTDILIQQISYCSTKILNIPTFNALLQQGTFIMTTFSESTTSNTIITVNLPELPTTGAYDGYSFQLRKLNGGINQTSQNWSIIAPAAIIIPNGNTLNVGSGGANFISTPSSLTQRYTIATVNNIGYYVGCNN
jgi:hypothetical protein